MNNLINSDALRFRSWFKEAAKLRGIPVIYQYPLEFQYTLHTELDWRTKYSEEFFLYAIFDENPRVTTLRNYGWISELPTDKPYLTYLPMDTPELSAGSHVTIPSSGFIYYFNSSITGLSLGSSLISSSESLVSNTQLEFKHQPLTKVSYISKYTRFRCNLHLSSSQDTSAQLSIKYLDNHNNLIADYSKVLTLSKGDNYVQNLELTVKLIKRMIIQSTEVYYRVIVSIQDTDSEVYLKYGPSSNLMTDLGDGRLFEVTDIKLNMQYADSYVCQVAPVFYQDPGKVDNNYSNSDDHYIKR